MKTVIYEGKEYSCPDWAKFIAADATGQVFAYEERPILGSGNVGYMCNGYKRCCTRFQLIGELPRFPFPILEIA
jgi:hypothetical protein